MHLYFFLLSIIATATARTIIIYIVQYAPDYNSFCKVVVIAPASARIIVLTLIAPAITIRKVVTV